MQVLQQSEKEPTNGVYRIFFPTFTLANVNINSPIYINVNSDNSIRCYIRLAAASPKFIAPIAPAKSPVG